MEWLELQAKQAYHDQDISIDCGSIDCKAQFWYAYQLLFLKDWCFLRRVLQEVRVIFDLFFSSRLLKLLYPCYFPWYGTKENKATKYCKQFESSRELENLKKCF